MRALYQPQKPLPRPRKRKSQSENISIGFSSDPYQLLLHHVPDRSIMNILLQYCLMSGLKKKKKGGQRKPMLAQHRRVVRQTESDEILYVRDFQVIVHVNSSSSNKSNHM